MHHASTGEPGGLWRFRGRAPQRYAGIGFTAQGFDECLPYRREHGSEDPRAAWIFDGVEAVAFAPDGKTALTAGDDATVRLWTVPAGDMVAIYTGPECPV